MSSMLKIDLSFLPYLYLFRHLRNFSPCKPNLILSICSPLSMMNGKPFGKMEHTHQADTTSTVSKIRKPVQFSPGFGKAKLC
jgi:hypothetical protein